MKKEISALLIILAVVVGFLWFYKQIHLPPTPTSSPTPPSPATASPTTPSTITPSPTTIPPSPTHPTGVPENWAILLNVLITLKDDGVAVIEMRQHPITLDGGDLWPVQKSLVREIGEIDRDLIKESCLLFSVNPKENVNYVLLEPFHADDSLETFYDKNSDGVFDEYKGAWVTRIAVIFTESPNVKEISNKTFEIYIDDFYTKQNPASWIDLVNITWSGETEILGYSVIPKEASKPKTTISQGFLLWENSNSIQAPDTYIIKAKLPRFGEYPYVLKQVKGEIEKLNTPSTIKQTVRIVISATVKNIGEIDGDFTVLLQGSKELTPEQTQIIYLKPGEERIVKFPVFPRMKGRWNLHFSLYYREHLLDEETKEITVT